MSMEKPTLSKLCSLCSRIFETPNVFMNNERPVKPPDQEDKSMIPWHHSLSAMEASATIGGCRLCALFLADKAFLDNDRCEEGYHIDPNEETWIRCPWRNSEWLTLHQGDNTISELFVQECEAASTSPSPKATTHFDQDSLDDLALPSDLDTSTDSKFSQEVTQRWYRECVDTHSNCSPKNAEFRPSRLVYVGTPDGKDIPRLCLSQDLPSLVRYATLSHCWGTLPILKLKKDNIKLLQLRISKPNLPQTFLDALQITARLGLQYLWIDSLCIIQDDPNDWRVQAVTMSDVYGNSSFNISASAAKDGSIGCFFQRNPINIQRVFVLVGKYDCDQRALHSIDAPGIRRRAVEAQPLDERAWAYQERFLAPRRIDYGSLELRWQCQQGTASETWPQFDSSIHASYHFRKDLRQQEHVWDKVVDDYSTRKLTFPDDKPEAIAGVAKWFARRFGDQYLAGLWLHQIEPQLLWSIDPPLEIEAATYSEATNSHPLNARNPSWSWTSTNYPVRMFLRGRPINRDIEIKIKVLDYQLTPGGYDVYGRLKEGALRVQCCRLWKLPEGEDNVVTRLGKVLSADVSSRDNSLEYLQRRIELTGMNEPLFAMLVLGMNSGRLTHGLLLRSTGRQKGEFQRLAIWHAFWTRPSEDLVWTIRTTTKVHDLNDFLELERLGLYHAPEEVYKEVLKVDEHQVRDCEKAQFIISLV